MGEGPVVCLLSLGAGPGVSLSLAWELGLATHLFLHCLLTCQTICCHFSLHRVSLLVPNVRCDKWITNVCVSRAHWM